MCGLAGYARNPKFKQTSNDLTLTQVIFEELLTKAESRGKHAVGISAHDLTGKGFVWKIALPATTAMKLPKWREAMHRADGAAVLLGHTRHATQDNAKRDDCAHPFRFGDLTGAHNGMIYNWKELEKAHNKKNGAKWEVDSEAVFDLLSRTKKPEKVLDKLNGYWALTWQRAGKLYINKTDDAQLAAAYVPALRTMFWHSNIDVLRAVLKTMDADTGADIWEIKPGRIYTYDPAKFDEKGTHAERLDVIYSARTGKKFNTRATGEQSYSVQRQLPLSTQPSFSDGKGWKTREELMSNSRKSFSLAEFDIEVQTMRRLILALQDQQLQDRREIDMLTHEVGELRGVVNMLSGDDSIDLGGPYAPPLPLASGMTRVDKVPF